MNEPILPQQPPPLPTPVLGYAIPGSMNPATIGGVWAQGKRLVMAKGAVLPRRCVKCNSPECEKVWHKKIYWAHPAWALLILIATLIALIVILIVRKSITVDACLCPVHAAKRRMHIWITTIMGLSIPAFIAGGIAITANAPKNSGLQVAGIVSIILGVVMIFVALLYGNYMVAPLRPSKIDNQYAWLLGAGPEFLASLDQTA